MFSAHNTFLYFWDRDSIKSRDIWKKICILCPEFPVCRDICGKNAYYVPYNFYNRTSLAPFCPYVPLDFCRRTFFISFVYMSHLDVITGHFWHFFVHMSYLSYVRGIFCSFFIYMSHLVLLAGFFRKQSYVS